MSSNDPRLDDMPQELIDIVIGHLDGADIMALRGTCREVKKKVPTAVFVETCFKHRNLLFSCEHSHRHAQDVLQSPFGAHIETLSIYLDEYLPGSTSRPALRSRTFQDNNRDIDELKRYLLALKKHGLQPSIIITSGAKKRFTRRPAKSPFSKQVVPPSLDDVLDFHRVLEAFLYSGFQPLEFKINGDTPQAEEWHLPIHKLVDDGELLFLESALADVQTLTLDIWCEEDNEHFARTFFDSIASLDKLTTLTIYGRDHSNSEHLDVFAPCELSISNSLFAKTLLQLKHLRLWGCEVWAIDLIPFLRKHKKEHQLEKFDIGALKIDWNGFVEEAVEGEVEETVEDEVEEKLSKLTEVEVGKFIE